MRTTGLLIKRYLDGSDRLAWSTWCGRLARYARPARSAWLGQDAASLAGLGYLAFSVFGLVVALVSTEPLHRLWGGCAAVGYCCATLAALAPAWLVPGRWRRDIALAAAVSGAVVVPLCWLAATGRSMPEVGVVAHSAELLVANGRPYQSAAQLGTNVYGYNPYLPGMTMFGLPRALFGGGLVTDPRVWDAIAFLTAFAAALRIASGGRVPALRRTIALSGTPLIAFPLAVSGNDLPVIGLICLGLALAGRGEADSRCSADQIGLAGPGVPAGPRVRAGRMTLADPVWTGVVLGVACALKATAWPALLVIGVLLATRDGRAATARCAAAAAIVLAVLVGPFLLIQPADLAVNTIAFPLGLTAVHSPAASPLPGHLIAATGHAGHLAVIALLVVTVVALGARLAARPPRSTVGAAGYLVLTLTALFTLAPATRWGYFCYPAVIGCWLWLAGRVPAPARPD